MTTIYKLNWGAGGRIPEQTRYFRPEDMNDAVVRLAEVVTYMDEHESISAAFASLTILHGELSTPDVTLLSWTKTSDERPNGEGFPSIEAALSRMLAEA